MDNITELFERLRSKKSPVDEGLVPGISDNVNRGIGSLVLNMVNENDLLQDLGDENHRGAFKSLYFGLTFTLSKSYIPGRPLMPSNSPLIRLAQDNPISAAFGILVMYSVRLRVMNQHVTVFDDTLHFILGRQGLGYDDQFGKLSKY